MHDHWNYGDPSSDREDERALLEGAKRISAAASSLWKHDYRIPLPDSVGCDVVRAKRGLSVLALNLDHPGRTHRFPKHRDLKQLGLGDEFVPRQVRCQGWNVKP